jgi:cytochrome c oxidase subunit 3
MEYKRNFLVHPSYIVLFLVLFAITSLFLAFSGSYIYNRIQHNAEAVQLPWLFYLNALILFLSSYSLNMAQRAYKIDATLKFKYYIFSALYLAIIFMIAQIFAWKQLMDQKVFIQYSNMASFIYLLSGAHLAHVLGGIPFLAYFSYDAQKKMKDPVTVFIYFSDELKLRRLKQIGIYWHYLDYLWIYLILFFLINTYI